MSADHRNNYTYQTPSSLLHNHVTALRQIITQMRHHAFLFAQAIVNEVLNSPGISTTLLVALQMQVGSLQWKVRKLQLALLARDAVEDAIEQVKPKTNSKRRGKRVRPVTPSTPGIGHPKGFTYFD